MPASPGKFLGFGEQKDWANGLSWPTLRGLALLSFPSFLPLVVASRIRRRSTRRRNLATQTVGFSNCFFGPATPAGFSRTCPLFAIYLSFSMRSIYSPPCFLLIAVYLFSDSPLSVFPANKVRKNKIKRKNKKYKFSPSISSS